MRIGVVVLAGCSYAPHEAARDAESLEVVADVAAARLDLATDHWLLPCIQNNNPFQTACTCDGMALTHDQITTGTPGAQFHVTVRIRGVMERMTYTGGTDGGNGWYVGGAPGDTGNNYYELAIDVPPAHYYLNSGSTQQSNSWPFDYTAMIDVAAGAKLTFEASGQDGLQWEGVDAGDQPITMPGVTDPAQPYNGQWAQLEVVGAEPF